MTNIIDNTYLKEVGKMKKSIIFVTAFLLVLLCSWGVLAHTGGITYTTVLFGSSISLNYPHTWSRKGYCPLDTNPGTPEGSILTHINVNWDVGGLGSFYDYAGVKVRLINESGDWTYVESDIINEYFAGQPAKQKFYIQFRVAYMEFPGYLMFLKPNVSFYYDKP